MIFHERRRTLQSKPIQESTFPARYLASYSSRARESKQASNIRGKQSELNRRLGNPKLCTVETKEIWTTLPPAPTSAENTSSLHLTYPPHSSTLTTLHQPCVRPSSTAGHTKCGYLFQDRSQLWLRYAETGCHIRMMSGQHLYILSQRTQTTQSLGRADQRELNARSRAK